LDKVRADTATLKAKARGLWQSARAKARRKTAKLNDLLSTVDLGEAPDTFSKGLGNMGQEDDGDRQQLEALKKKLAEAAEAKTELLNRKQVILDQIEQIEDQERCSLNEMRTLEEDDQSGEIRELERQVQNLQAQLAQSGVALPPSETAKAKLSAESLSKLLKRTSNDAKRTAKDASHPSGGGGDAHSITLASVKTSPVSSDLPKGFKRFKFVKKNN
jgi:seryl-tRNA synthetase